MIYKDHPKYLYHGTSLIYAQQIMKSGLRPRYLTGIDTNWGVTPSTMDMVYLSNTIPFYFALQTKESAMLESTPAPSKTPLHVLNMPCVLEISLKELNKNLFYPDEDYTALQYLDRTHGYSNVEESSKLARRLVKKCRHLWLSSLYSLGVCAYQGVIPAKAITQVCIFDQDKNYDLASHFYRSPVTFPETSVHGNTYQAVVEWIFGRISENEFYSPYSREGLSVLTKGDFLQTYGI